MSVYDTPVEYLHECIDSILTQTYQNFEFIIINDGSKKFETCNALKEYSKKDSRIKLIRNEKNIGLTKSLNIGLAEARGKYIARMDADDIAISTRFEEQWNFMEQHSEIVVLGTWVEKFGCKQEKEPMYFIDYTQGNYEEFLINMMFYNVANIHPTVMLRHDFLRENQIRYDENIKKAQDYKLWIDCIKHGGKMYNLPTVLLKYRVHENQITSKSFDEQYSCIRDISCEAIKTYGFEMEEEHYKLLTDLYTPVYLCEPSKYIEAIKKMQNINRTKNLFEQKAFIETLRVRWLHKVIKSTIKSRDIRSWLCVYTWQCVFSSAMIKWIRLYVLKNKQIKKYETEKRM